MISLETFEPNSSLAPLTSTASIQRVETQRILEAHLASLGGEVERGVTATKVEPDTNGVLVELTHKDGGLETVHPSFVIGAGGAHSITRESMGEALEGGTYQGYFLVADYGESAADTGQPHPGRRYPDWTRFGGTSHHLLVFGPIPGAEALAQLARRWFKRVEISRDPPVDPLQAGVPTGGLVLIRPDGHIGFRSPFADARVLTALDHHLSDATGTYPSESMQSSWSEYSQA